MPNFYEHIPLLHRDSIRVLYLKPSQLFEAPIELELHEERIEEANFEALSYTWGPKGNDQSVLCSGKQLAVQPNCLAALRRLRDPSCTRHLFVDAICIDQRAVGCKEREHQIQLMGEIYSKAKRVLIWLGEGSKKVDLAFQHFRLLYPILHHLVYDDGSPSNTFVAKTVRLLVWYWSRVHNVKFAGLSFGRYQPLHFWFEFLNCDYFERVWTLQETAVATDALLVCGSSTVNFGAAKCVIDFMYPRWWDMRKKPLGLDDDSFGRRMNGYHTHRELAQVFRLKNHRDIGQRPEDANRFRELVLQTRELIATDPRDKLFSLYATLHGFADSFPKPNYDESLKGKHFWPAATHALLEATRSLDILMDVHHEKLDDGLPSWSVDWGKPSSETKPWSAPLDLLEREHPTNLAWNTPPSSSTNTDPKRNLKLKLKGIVRTKIRRRSPETHTLRDWIHNTWETAPDKEEQQLVLELDGGMRWMTDVIYNWVVSPMAPGLSHPVSELELSREMLKWEQEPGQPEYHQFETWYSTMLKTKACGRDAYSDPTYSIEKLNKIGDRFHYTLCYRRLFRCMFETADGRLGDGYYTVEEGDLVVLFCWSKLPAIVRASPFNDDEYRLVCFAYIQGLVDCHEWDLKEEELQEFTLV